MNFELVVRKEGRFTDITNKHSPMSGHDVSSIQQFKRRVNIGLKPILSSMNEGDYIPLTCIFSAT